MQNNPSTINFFERNVSFLTSGILPGIYLVATLLIDHLTPQGTISPFFIVLGMMIMALRLHPRYMIPWTIFYTLTICSIFISPQIHHLFSKQEFHTPLTYRLLRAATYLLVGVGFCYLCVIFHKLSRNKKELSDIFSNLPCPIMASDHNGKILYWNRAVEALIPTLAQKRDKKQKLQSFFDLFAPAENKGKIISGYLQRLECEEPMEPLDLALKGIPIKGHTQTLEWNQGRVLITILRTEEYSITSLH